MSVHSGLPMSSGVDVSNPKPMRPENFEDHDRPIVMKTFVIVLAIGLTTITLLAAAPPVGRKEPVRDGPPARRARDPESVESLARKLSLFTGKNHTILLNKSLATPEDGKLSNALSLHPAALLEATRFVMGAGIDAGVTAQVFDGKQFHPINLDRPLPNADIFTYSDPWGETTFLAKDNNQAGVDARADPVVPRKWLVKGDEFQKVLYAVILPEYDTIAVFLLMYLLDRSPDEFVATMAARKAQNANDPLISESFFRQIGSYLRSRGAYQQALATYRAMATLHPGSEDAAREVIQAYKDAGQPVPTRSESELHREFMPAAPGEAPVLGDMLKTDFFTFFHLQQDRMEEDTRIGGRRVYFKPAGPRFHDLVTVVLTVTADDHVTGQKLILARSFIDDPGTAIFARDIAKTYLSNALNREELLMAARLYEDIWQFESQAEVPIPGAFRAEAKVPVLISPGFQTFVGKGPDYKESWPRNSLSLSNTMVEEVPCLVIAVVRK